MPRSRVLRYCGAFAAFIFTTAIASAILPSTVVHDRPVQFTLTAAHAAEGGFYSQPPMSEPELMRFIDTFPKFREWSRTSGDRPAPMTDGAGNPSFTWSEAAAAKVTALGWQPDRFFFVLGKAAACLAVIENGATYKDAGRPPDMPPVTDGEIAIVQRNLVSLLRVTSE